MMPSSATAPVRRPIWPLFPLGVLSLFVALCVGEAGWGLPDWRTPSGAALLSLRGHRAMAGFLVGAALSAAGAVLQGLLRNPLADPYVLGVSSGAGLGAAGAILTGWTLASVWALPVAAFAGGLAALGLVYLLAAAGRESPSLYGLLLSGVIVSAMGSSLLMMLVSFAPAHGMHGILWWMLGNLQSAGRELLLATGGLVLLALVAMGALGHMLNALSLGRDQAHHLGVRTRVVTLTGLALASLLTAAAVALAGIVAFVGLVVPHAARAWLGPDQRRLPLGAALMGGVFLVLCDIAGRTLAAPREIPIGVITSLLGGPFFLYVLVRRRARGWVE